MEPLAAYPGMLKGKFSYINCDAALILIGYRNLHLHARASRAQLAPLSSALFLHSNLCKRNGRPWRRWKSIPPSSPDSQKDLTTWRSGTATWTILTYTSFHSSSTPALSWNTSKPIGMLTISNVGWVYYTPWYVSTNCVNAYSRLFSSLTAMREHSATMPTRLPPHLKMGKSSRTMTPATAQHGCDALSRLVSLPNGQLPIRVVN